MKGDIQSSPAFAAPFLKAAGGTLMRTRAASGEKCCTFQSLWPKRNKPQGQGKPVSSKKGVDGRGMQRSKWIYTTCGIFSQVSNYREDQSWIMKLSIPDTWNFSLKVQCVRVRGLHWQQWKIKFKGMFSLVYNHHPGFLQSTSTEWEEEFLVGCNLQPHHKKPVNPFNLTMDKFKSGSS